MITIESLVEQGANVKLEVTPTDLEMFAESIVQRTIMAQQEEHKAAMQREAEEGWLNTKQVRELLNVCRVRSTYGRSAAILSRSRSATRTYMPSPMCAVCRREASQRV